MTDKSR